MASVNFCECCGAEIDPAFEVCSFCGYEQPSIVHPTYSQVFEEPFARLECSTGLERLEHLSVILEQIDCDLTVFLATAKHAEKTGQKRC